MISTMSNFKQRLTVSSILIFCMLVAIYFSHHFYIRPIFTFLVATIIGTAIWEYYQLAHCKKFEPLVSVGISASIFYIFAVFLSTQASIAEYLPETVLLMTLLTCFIYYFSHGTNPLGDLAVTLFGIVYLAIPLGCIININYFFSLDSIQDGRWWLIYLLAVTKCTDMAAYFFGKKFGRHQLAPYISPKKTWEGALGGLLIGVVTSGAIAYLVNKMPVTPPLHLQITESLWLGGLISVLGQTGDLAESLLKRDAGVKDSNQLPGLGGTLDTVDSLVFTAPLLYIFLMTRFT